MENKDTIENLARAFKIFGDATRIKIMYTMLDREICVQDIAKNLEMTQSAISHQLSILKGARLIKSRKEGKEVYYSLDDDHVKRILDVGVDHVEERG